MLPDLGDVGGRTHRVGSLHRRHTARAFQSRSRSALEAPSLRLGFDFRPPGSGDLRRVARGEVAHWRGRGGRRFGRGARRGSLHPAAPGRKPSTARASTFSSTTDGVTAKWTATTDGYAQAVTFGLLMARARDITLANGLDRVSQELRQTNTLIGAANASSVAPGNKSFRQSVARCVSLEVYDRGFSDRHNGARGQSYELREASY